MARVPVALMNTPKGSIMISQHDEILYFIGVCLGVATFMNMLIRGIYGITHPDPLVDREVMDSIWTDEES
jgi:hypothetical protein